MNEEQMQNKLELVANKAKEKLTEVAKEALSDVWNELLPHALSDTTVNVQYCAEDALRKLIQGNFIFEHGYAKVDCGDYSIDIRLDITSGQYDELRKSLIRIMPKCPKDLEIESLREQLREAYKSGYQRGGKSVHDKN